MEEDRADRTVVWNVTTLLAGASPLLGDYGVNRWDRSDGSNRSPPENGWEIGALVFSEVSRLLPWGFPSPVPKTESYILIYPGGDSSSRHSNKTCFSELPSHATHRLIQHLCLAERAYYAPSYQLVLPHNSCVLSEKNKQQNTSSSYSKATVLSHLICDFGKVV